uniref:Mobilization protein A n=1 Tax=Paracoccus marcusii TaxID=59779 RepID=R4QSN1_9RHOB|nr:mobilization protein A [Paracoccus marcusii]
MLIKFTSGGRGGGAEIAAYLTAGDREGRGHAPPKVVRGDMERTRELIDSIERKWSYTHGVLSFALEDAPTKDQQEEAMDAFERLAFAGMDPEQYDITWVRHQHTEGGRVELHFVTPRMELTTGKALNVAPPGWERSYASLRDMLNWSQGWARPDDAERATELHRAPERADDAFRLREGREGIHAYLTALVAAERVTDRGSIVLALQEAGLQVPRQGKDYLTVQDPDSGEKFRMKGRIYEKEWTYDRELERTVATAAVESDGRDRGIDLGRADAAREQLEATIRSRAAHHAERYPKYEPDDGRRTGDHALDRALVVGGADRDLAGDRRLVSLALDEPRAGPVFDLPERGAELSGSARGDRTDDLPRGAAVSMPQTAEWDLSYEPTDSLRAGAARAIRDIGQHLRDLARSVRSHIEAVADLVRDHAKAPGQDRAETERDRGLSSAFTAVLKYSDRANHELGTAGERVAQRTLTLVEERKALEWEQEWEARRERSRGDDYGL